MKVTFRRILYGDIAHERFYKRVSPTDTQEIETVGELEYCCRGMNEVWGDVIGFGPRDSWGIITEGDMTAQIYLPDRYEGYDCYPIKFCPLCGEVIEYDEAPALTQVKKIEEVPAIPATERVTYVNVLVDNQENDNRC